MKACFFKLKNMKNVYYNCDFFVYVFLGHMAKDLSFAMDYLIMSLIVSRLWTVLAT